MEDPWKPVVNTVTIRLDGKGNKSGRRKKKWEKWRRREGEGEGEKEWRSTFPCVPRRSRSTWFVRASMWANNAHFGSNRDALHFVHYSVHVSMWSGCREERGGGKGGYTLPPSLLERCQQHRVARKLPMPRRYTAKGSPAHRPLLKDRSSATPRNSLRGK